MEIRNPVIPNAIAGQSSINSRLPVKADKFAVDPNNSKTPTTGDEKQRNRVTQEERKETQKPVEKVNEEKEQNSEGLVEPQNPLVLARQLSGQLATVPNNEPSTELVLQGKTINQDASAGESEPVPRSIQTYLDTSKISAEDSNNKNIDFFI